MSQKYKYESNAKKKKNEPMDKFYESTNSTQHKIKSSTNGGGDHARSTLVRTLVSVY